MSLLRACLKSFRKGGTISHHEGNEGTHFLAFAQLDTCNNTRCSGLKAPCDTFRPRESLISFETLTGFDFSSVYIDPVSMRSHMLSIHSCSRDEKACRPKQVGLIYFAHHTSHESKCCRHTIAANACNDGRTPSLISTFCELLGPFRQDIDCDDKIEGQKKTKVRKTDTDRGNCLDFFRRRIISLGSKLSRKQ